MRARTVNPLLQVFVLSIFLAAGMPWGAGATLEQRQLTDVEAPLQVVLNWTGQPGLQRTVTLTVQVTPLVQADDLVLRWIVPTGVTLAGPADESLGSVAAGQAVTRQRDVTLDQVGTFQVSAYAQMRSPEQPATFGSSADLFFTIRDGPGSEVSRQGPGISSPHELISTPEVHYTVSADPHAGFWVRGRFMYQDVPVDPVTGAGAPVWVPARQVRVEIWEDDGWDIFDDHDGTVRTDDNGYFSFYDGDNDDGWFGGDKEIYLKVFPNTPGAYVTDRTWIDDEYYCYTGNQTGGADIDFGTLTPTNFHRMFNISDILLDANRYVSQFRSPVEQAKVQYEPGYGESVSFYDSFWGEITLADAGGDDGYDDSVIAHEYGHFLAAAYSCDDSPGGPHNLTDHINKDLAWSEGWASYLSSAVRGTSWYMDWDFGALGWSVLADWEPWTVTGSDNEGAVTGTLWDIHDSVDESYDHMTLGGDEIWQTIQDGMGDSFWTDLFQSCDIFVFWDEWLAASHPDDSELAAIFAQFQTAGLGPAMAGQADKQVRSAPAEPLAARVVRAGPAFGPDGRARAPQAVQPDTVERGGVPWNAVLFEVDATNSMAAKIAAVRQIIQDKVTAMDAEPNPYEYIVEKFQDNGVNTPVVDHFFPDVVNPPVGSIVVGGGGDSPEDSFDALARGTTDRTGYDAWLFTDAAPKQTAVTEAQLEGLLQSRQITPYFFIFGDCSGGNTPGASAAGTPHLVPPGQLHLPRFSPDGLEECVEPYLLVAGGTNGQFLLIDTSQINDAAEIVRAFMSNNAGAGRYANYVSTDWAYSWDDVPYNWYDASGGTYWNIYDRDAVALPQPFSFYNNPYQTVYVAAPGYVSFSDFSSDVNNTGIPTPALPNNAIYAFWDNVTAYTIGAEAGPEQTPAIFTNYDAANNRFAIEYLNAYHWVTPSNYETFEILLDYATGKITLQYAQVTDDSSNTVGVENAAGTAATQAIYNNPGALYAGRAIQFTPLPPHPYNDHPVVVDSSMSGVIFLLNGYSGAVNLTVYHPNGTPVNPGDPGVTFLDVGRIKYYRVVSPEAGTWTARASGNGTYYFTSSATSPLTADSQGDPTMSTLVFNHLLIDLGITVTNASFSLVYPDGSLFDNLTLYDDGTHNDGGANDGLYGGGYDAPAAGTFYMQVDGQTLGGETFRRTALIPLRFQDMELAAPWPGEWFALPGDTMVYTFTLYNDGPTAQTFDLTLDSNQGWASLPYGSVAVGAYGSTHIPVTVHVPYTAWNVVEQTTLTAQTSEMADHDSVATTVRGPVTSISLMAQPSRIGTNGEQAVITAEVKDDLGWNVADGTAVAFNTTLGSVNPAAGTTLNGWVTTTLTSDASTGIAQVQATADAVSGLVAVDISAPVAYSITLAADPSLLPPDGTSTAALTAHVYDPYGNPAPDGTAVIFSVAGDEMIMGSIAGQEAYTATTSAGVATATYQSGTTAGRATVGAAISLGGTAGGGEGSASWRWATADIVLTSGTYSIFLPLVFR